MAAPATDQPVERFFDFDTGTAVESQDGPPEPIPAEKLRVLPTAEESPTGEAYVDAAVDSEYANRAASLAEEAEDDTDELLLDAAEDGEVRLCSGAVIDGSLVLNARVRELNGADEEAMARVGKSGNLVRFVDTILKCGVEQVGDVEGKELSKVLDAMLIGDRDQLVMEVRRQTFGDTIRLDVRCPNVSCGAEFQVDYSLSKDVPMKRLAECFPDETVDLSQRQYDINLPSGRTAVVKLIDGEAQKATYSVENTEKTGAELNSELLRHCVLFLDGRPVRGVGAVRDTLSLRDRRELLKWLTDHTTGPQYGEVTQECDDCEMKFPLLIDVLTLFRGE
jgi:hypothetical protein